MPDIFEENYSEEEKQLILKDIIKLTDESREIPKLQGMPVSYPATAESLQDFFNSAKGSKFTNAEKIYSMIKEMDFLSRKTGSKLLGKSNYSDLDDRMIAARMFDHDIMRQISNFDAIMEFYLPKNFTLPVRGLHDANEANEALESLQAYKMLSLTAGYLASKGNKSYLAWMPSSDLEKVLISSIERHLLANNYVRFAIDPSITEVSNIDFNFVTQTLRNALKYGGDMIDISAKRVSPEYTEFTVENDKKGIINKDGSPISMAELPNIFAPNYTNNGTGLGLYTVKRLAIINGNKVTVETSHDGKKAFRYVVGQNSGEQGEVGPYETEWSLDRPGTKFIRYSKNFENADNSIMMRF